MVGRIRLLILKGIPMTKEQSSKLCDLLFDAHYKVACRNNPSFNAFINAYQNNGKSVAQAIAAGLSTMGGRHAPINNTIIFIKSMMNNPNAVMVIHAMMEQGMPVPGFGTSFFKECQVDPAFVDLENFIFEIAPEFRLMAEGITEILYQYKKVYIYANPSFYTVVSGIILGLSKSAIQNLLIRPRTIAWMDYVETNHETL